MITFLQAFKLAIKGFWTKPKKLIICSLYDQNKVYDVTDDTDEEILNIIKKERENGISQ